MLIYRARGVRISGIDLAGDCFASRNKLQHMLGNQIEMNKTYEISLEITDLVLAFAYSNNQIYPF